MRAGEKAKSLSFHGSFVMPRSVKVLIGAEIKSELPKELSLGHGGVAEWSCSGLQSRVRRFDSDPRLQEFFVNPSLAAFSSSYFNHSRQRLVMPWTRVLTDGKTSPKLAVVCCLGRCPLMG